MDRKPGNKELEQRIKDLEKLIHKQKKNESKLLKEISELKQTEKYYNALMQNTEDYVLICDGNGIPLAFNASYKNRGEELLNIEIKPGMQPHKLAGDPEIVKYWDSLQSRVLKGEKFLAEFFDKERQEYYETIFCPIKECKEVIGFTEITRDITDRKRAEEEEKKLQAQLSNAIEIAHLGPWEYDVTKDVFTFNEYFYKIFHTTAKEVGGYEMSSDEYAKRFLHPDDMPRVKEETQKAIDAKNPNYSRQLEHKIIYVDGTVGHINVRFFIVKDENGKTIKTYGVNQDITKRVLAEKALKESEQRYRSLVEKTNDGYFVCEIPSGSFLFLNQQICDLFGYTMEEGLGLTLWDMIVPTEHQFIKDFIKTCIEGKEEINLSSNIQNATSKDGTTLRIEVSISMVTYQGKPVIQGLLRDITETERLRSKLELSQRLEAVGTLAGGLAHDFNNLLMGILGNASLMLLEIEPTDPHYSKLKNIEEYVQNGAELTKQMLGFARGGKYEIKSTDMNKLVKKSSHMFGQTKKEIIIHTEYQKDIWNVAVDQGQINQVLLNLYVNAWQSMPGGGDLYLETKNIVLDDIYVKPYNVAPGNYVKVSVTDTGVGMDEATKKRIFNPFFTTKEMGRGTGLGLATVYGIIKNHGGIINVYSEKGEGSTFNIYLPASEKILTKAKESSNDILRGNETILLVDDEDMIINVGRQFLEELGYNVLIAKTGNEALEIFKNNKEKIDLVILDMIMPYMGGGVTYDKLKEIDPDAKVLLSSGYSLNGQAAEILKRGCNGFIQKPFSIKDLSHKIRELLDKE